MLIFRFIILFLVTARIVLHALMLRQMQQFYHAVLCSSMYSPSVWHNVSMWHNVSDRGGCLDPVALRPPSEIPSLLWLVSSHTSEPALFIVSPVGCVMFSASGNLTFTLNKGIHFANVFDALWESGLPFVWTLDFLTSKTFYIHKNLYKTLKKREKK